MAPRILLLGLEPDVRALLRRVLAAGGFSVFEAQNVDEAQRLASGADVELFIAGKEIWEHRLSEQFDKERGAPRSRAAERPDLS